MESAEPTAAQAITLFIVAFLVLPMAGCVDRDEAEQPGNLLRVAALFNDQDLQLRFEYPTETPSWYHQYLVYRNGEWTRYGLGADGRDEHGFYEDRISVMWDDGSVRNFENLGGYVAVHPGMRSTRSEVDSDAVGDHSYLGDELGRSDVRKFILESRDSDVSPLDAWEAVLPEDQIRELLEAGVFLDLWQWRAHRSNPIGFADNGYVLDYRHSSSGRGMYTDNVDDSGAPAWMYDSEKTGFHALLFEQLVEQAYSQDDWYFLSESIAKPFDPEHDWQDGDALPQRFLREPEGSRGAIRADGRHSDGAWQVRLTRSMEAPDPLDSKSFAEGDVFHVAFSVHSGAGARHHLVSLPLSFGFATDAEIIAQKVEGDLDEAEVEWVEIELFDPGDPTPER
ncbi:MAG: hypothetical protein JJU20_00955 [Opitutales bacterium]|nr:hypothetical protein [Opitutales bacterium]